MSASQTFGRYTPADGTLNPAATTTYGARTRDNVIPWNVIGPQPGEVWRVDSFFVTNIHTTVAYFTISIALNNLLRSDVGGSGLPVIKYGNPLQPVSHYAWGRALAAGESEGIEAGGELLRGNGPLGVPTGTSLWLGAWPGTNVNPLGAGNDGVPAGIVIAVHGERLA